MENLYVFKIVALSSIIFQMLCYVLISLRVKSWINFASFPVLGNVITNCLLPYLGIDELGVGGSLFAFSFCQITYCAISLGILIATLLPAPRLRFLRFISDQTEYSPVVPWFFLLCSILLFLPVLITFGSSLANPRLLYTQTRTGYGPIFFLSTTLTLLAWGSFLFVKRKLWQTTVFFCICAVITYLHGSKGQLIFLLMVYVFYRVYLLGKRVSWKMFLPAIAFGLISMAAIVILLSGPTVTTENVLVWSEGFSTYTQNAMAVIDHPTLFGVPNYGRITFETEFYTRIPRFLYPGKPSDYGIFELAKIYYPAAYDAGVGDPAFGIGIQYDDFGILALPILFFTSILITWLTIGVIQKTKNTPTPGLFLLLIFLCGIPVIPSGAGYLLPETIILGYGTNMVFRYWISLRRVKFT